MNHRIRRTYDSVQQPFTAWGMTYLRGDIAKITQFLNVDGGQVNGEMLFDQFEFDAAQESHAIRSLCRSFGIGNVDYDYAVIADYLFGGYVDMLVGDGIDADDRHILCC